MIDRDWQKLRTLLCGALMLASAPAAAQTPSDSDLARADELYRQGNVAFDAGKLDEAVKLYSEAFKLKPSYDIAGNLGAAELKLGMQREAAEHLGMSLRLFPVNGKPQARKVTVDALAEAKQKVGCFTFSVDVAGAKVSLGDRVVGTSPLLDAVCAYPGPSKVKVERDGYEVFEQDVVAETTGTDKPVTVVLKKAAGGAGAGGAGGGTGDEPAEKPIWPAILLGGVGAAGVAVGIAGVVVGAQKDGDASDLAASASCTPAVTDACIEDGDALASDWATFNTVGIVGFGVGGAALIGMTIYLLVPGPQAEKSAWQVVPWIDPKTAGVTVGRSF